MKIWFRTINNFADHCMIPGQWYEGIVDKDHHLIRYTAQDGYADSWGWPDPMHFETKPHEVDNVTTILKHYESRE